MTRLSTNVTRILDEAVGSREIPGVVAMAASGENVRYKHAAGTRALSGESEMTLDSVFWIASMTKAITATAAMQMVEQGKLSLDGPIAETLPELAELRVLEGFADDGTPKLRAARRPITLRHLLTHTAGFSYDMWNGDMLRYLQMSGLPRISSAKNDALKTPIVSDPGERWEYGTNIDFAGKAVEVVSGLRLDAYLHTHVLEPLGMFDTGFKLTPALRERRVGMHSRNNKGSLALIPHEVEQNPEFYVGGSGLYGTAPDYLKFCQMILNNGRGPAGEVLNAQTVALMRENHIGELNMEPMKSSFPTLTNDIEFYPGTSKKWGLSFMINTVPTPEGRSPGSLSWAGLANTYYWIDPARDIAGVMMMQILPFGDKRCLDAFAGFERAIYELVNNGEW